MVGYCHAADISAPEVSIAVSFRESRWTIRAEGEEMSVAYCDISGWLLFSSLVLTIVALVLTWRDRAKASIICFGFVLLQIVVASLLAPSCSPFAVTG